jgi:2-polyprenyl-3-methyl-5-hydroxy-6-metoxy-1,4-benzoquinol methylase
MHHERPEILRGGDDKERLYLRDLDLNLSSGEHLIVKKTYHPGANMLDLIARHKGRYCLLGLYSRPGYKLLDFPCGSGYGVELLRQFGVIYQGRDVDPYTIEYANRVYSDENSTFRVGDLTKPELGKEQFEVIGCIEGLEHIAGVYQSPLIKSFYNALVPGGTLVISSPKNTTGQSGPSVHNPYHLWELNRTDFLELLNTEFKSENVELVTHKAVLSTGVLTTCFYGICHKLESE